MERQEFKELYLNLGENDFPQKQALSLFSIHSSLTPCKKSGKTNEAILRTLK